MPYPSLLLALAAQLYSTHAPQSPATRESPTRLDESYKWTLSSIVEDCDRIVEAEVVAVRQVQRSIPRNGKSAITLVELRVQRVLWGESDCETLQLFDDPFFSYLHDHGTPRPGDRDLWFLERSRFSDSEDAETLARLTDLSGKYGVQTVVNQGLGRFPIEGPTEKRRACVPAHAVRLPPGWSFEGSESTTGHKGVWKQIDLARLEDWIRASATELCPSVRAILFCNGPETPCVMIAKDGRCDYGAQGSLDKRIQLAPTDVQEIVELADRERFLDLPGCVGMSPGPDSSACILRIRTSKGSRSIRIEGWPPTKSDPTAVSLYACARRILKAIPIAQDWKF